MSNQRPAFLTTEASGGQPDKDLLLYRMTGSEHISEPYQFKLELLSDQLDVAALDYLGKLMTVVVQPGIFPDRYFSGLVSEFSLAGWEGEKAKYLVTLRPWFWFLTKTHNCRIFQNLSVLDITKEIFREHGFSDFEEQLNSDYSPREYCV
jgi:type VI secretion system secreted protein VgrG